MTPLIQFFFSTCDASSEGCFAKALIAADNFYFSIRSSGIIHSPN